MVTPLADLLALVEDPPGNAVPGALRGGFLDLGIAAVERGVAGIAERAAGRVAPQLANRFAAHPDMLAGGGDAVGVGELLDKRDLALGGPAVVAAADGNGFEGDEGFVFRHCASKEKGGEPVISSMRL